MKYKELLESYVSRICDGRPGVNRQEVRDVLLQAIKSGVQVGYKEGIEYAMSQQEQALNRLKKAFKADIIKE